MAEEDEKEVDMIDRKVQQELREKYSPDGSLLRRGQLRMLDILKAVDNICRGISDLPYLRCGRHSESIAPDILPGRQLCHFV